MRTGVGRPPAKCSACPWQEGYSARGGELGREGRRCRGATRSVQPNGLERRHPDLSVEDGVDVPCGIRVRP
jgi:hypothetical protein